MLGKNWTLFHYSQEERRSRSQGPYALIRHPIYSGIVLGLFGTALAIGKWRGLVAIAILFSSYFVKARREEALLIVEFGRGQRSFPASASMLAMPRRFCEFQRRDSRVFHSRPLAKLLGHVKTGTSHRASI